ncbi:11159_t:CDS:2 [Entrophospora sp. SA101]|nr:11159_t:CDS:2 [Entrophospora sp. SA101]
MGCKTKISKRLGMQLITIYNILERYNKEGTVENDKRSGKPKSLSDRDLNPIENLSFERRFRKHENIPIIDSMPKRIDAVKKSKGYPTQ